MRVKIDECLDANGNYTIRLDDGTPNGDTEAQPICTAYCENSAQVIVAAINGSNVGCFLRNNSKGN